MHGRQFMIIIQISLSQHTPGPHSCTKVEYTMQTIPATVCLRACFWLRFADHLSLWYINLHTQRPSSPSSHLLVQYPKRLKVDVRRIRDLPTIARCRDTCVSRCAYTDQCSPKLICATQHSHLHPTRTRALRCAAWYT